MRTTLGIPFTSWIHLIARWLEEGYLQQAQRLSFFTGILTEFYYITFSKAQNATTSSYGKDNIGMSTYQSSMVAFGCSTNLLFFCSLFVQELVYRSIMYWFAEEYYSGLFDDTLVSNSDCFQVPDFSILFFNYYFILLQLFGRGQRCLVW